MSAAVVGWATAGTTCGGGTVSSCAAVWDCGCGCGLQHRGRPRCSGKFCTAQISWKFTLHVR